MPEDDIGLTRRLRPVHQYLKITNGIIDLDSRGLVQSVTEDFDDNDVVDPRYITSTNVVKFDNNIKRNASDTVVWIKGDLAIVDGKDTNRADTGTYVYIGNDQGEAAATVDSDWELLSVIGQFEVSNQLNTWNPKVTYYDRDQVSFGGKFYTANLDSVESIIGGFNPAESIVNDQGIWIEGFADSTQGVRADGSVQFLDLETVHRTLPSGLLGVRFEEEVEVLDGGDSQHAIGTTVTRGTVDTSVLQRLIPSPDRTETSPGVLTFDDPSQIFLKFDPTAGASNRDEGDWRASRINYGDLVESPTVFLSSFDTSLIRNEHTDIAWNKGDQVIIEEDTRDTEGVLLFSKGAYVYIGDNEKTTTVYTDWQFLGINTLAESAVQSIVTVDGTADAVELTRKDATVTIPVAKTGTDALEDEFVVLSTDGKIDSGLLDISGKQDNITAGTDLEFRDDTLNYIGDLTDHLSNWDSTRQYVENDLVDLDGIIYRNNEIFIDEGYSAGSTEMLIQTDSGTVTFISSIKFEGNTISGAISINDDSVTDLGGGNYSVRIGNRLWTSTGVSRNTSSLSATRDEDSFTLRLDETATVGESPTTNPEYWERITTNSAEIAAIGNITEGIEEYSLTKDQADGYAVNDIVWYKHSASLGEEINLFWKFTDNIPGTLEAGVPTVDEGTWELMTLDNAERARVVEAILQSDVTQANGILSIGTVDFEPTHNIITINNYDVDGAIDYVANTYYDTDIEVKFNDEYFNKVANVSNYAGTYVFQSSGIRYQRLQIVSHEIGGVVQLYIATGNGPEGSQIPGTGAVDGADEEVWTLYDNNPNNAISWHKIISNNTYTVNDSFITFNDGTSDIGVISLNQADAETVDLSSLVSTYDDLNLLRGVLLSGGFVLLAKGTLGNRQEYKGSIANEEESKSYFWDQGEKAWYDLDDEITGTVIVRFKNTN